MKDATLALTSGASLNDAILAFYTGGASLSDARLDLRAWKEKKKGEGRTGTGASPAYTRESVLK